MAARDNYRTHQSVFKFSCLSEDALPVRQRRIVVRQESRSYPAVIVRMLLSPFNLHVGRGDNMKVLAVHPSALMYTKIYLRLEPLGLELVAQAIRQAGHEVRLMDLQVESHRDYFKLLQSWQPDVIAFSCNYLANVPEVVDLAKLTKAALPQSFVFVGGHSASF